jgi:hypothetical protein
MKLDEQLVVFLTAAELAGSVHVGDVPQAIALPCVWINRSSRTRERSLQAEAGDLLTTTFAVECIAESIGGSQSLADAVSVVLDSFRGPLVEDEAAVQAIFVEDASDDYIPRNSGGDAGFFVVSLTVTVFHSAA